MMIEEKDPRAIEVELVDELDLFTVIIMSLFEFLDFRDWLYFLYSCVMWSSCCNLLIIYCKLPKQEQTLQIVMATYLKI